MNLTMGPKFQIHQLRPNGPFSSFIFGFNYLPLINGVHWVILSFVHFALVMLVMFIVTTTYSMKFYIMG